MNMMMTLGMRDTRKYEKLSKIQIKYFIKNINYLKFYNQNVIYLTQI